MTEKIPHWLTKQAFLSPHLTAIDSANGESMSFLQLKQACQKYASKLQAWGIKKGSHVGILSANETKMIIAFHALTYIGAVTVFLNTRLTEHELLYQVNDADVSYIITSDFYKVTGQNIFDSDFVKSFNDVEKITEVPSGQLIEELCLDEPCTIMYTSGTTGNPKGVVHTYGNHWWSAISSSLHLGLHKDDKWLCMLPIFHIGGLSIFIKSVIYGMPVYLLEKFDENKANDIICNQRITMASAVTFMLQKMVDSIQNTGSFPSSFRCMLLGGGSVPESLLKRAHNLRVPVVQTFGMTETSSQIATLSAHDALHKIGSSGKALFPAQIKISDQMDESIGEILVKGPMVTKGYYHHDVANKDSFDEEWLKTGDLGYLDKEGFLYVVDRRTDLIISGGENIYPSEIEHVLMQLPEIQEAGVVGKNDTTWGQVPVAFIVKKTANLTKEDINTFVKSRLASYKRPKEIHFIDKLPRNASNKLLRRELAKLI